jgi:hypothetical protein
MESGQLIHIALSIAGSFLAAYVGVRVAIAEIRRDIAAVKEAHRGTVERVERLEQPYFQRGPVV